MNRLIILALAIGMLSGCTENSQEELRGDSIKVEAPLSKPDIYGNFVSDGYHKKNEGYDWVSVSISPLDQDQIHIKVRSRADRKKPTCTFDATARKAGDALYKASLNGKNVLFQLQHDTLVLETENPEDKDVLNFYCSGGASIAGKYKKLEVAIDSAQIDHTQFFKILQLQGIGFRVSSIPKEGLNVLTVAPFGLEISNLEESMEIEGTVTDAEVEDLNSDGSPELLIYTKMENESHSGNVYAFSVNNRKSMSQVYFPPTSDNPKINQGYNGMDEFAIVETYLVQRFPIYEEKNDSMVNTGKTRQISYTLIDGEAMRRFEVDKVTEY